MNNAQIKVIFLDIGGALLNNGWGHRFRKNFKTFMFVQSVELPDMLAQAAQKQGIRSFHYQNFSSTKKILEELKNDI